MRGQAQSSTFFDSISYFSHTELFPAPQVVRSNLRGVTQLLFENLREGEWCCDELRGTVFYTTNHRPIGGLVDGFFPPRPCSIAKSDRSTMTESPLIRTVLGLVPTLQSSAALRCRERRTLPLPLSLVRRRAAKGLYTRIRMGLLGSTVARLIKRASASSQF